MKRSTADMLEKTWLIHMKKKAPVLRGRERGEPLLVSGVRVSCDVIPISDDVVDTVQRLCLASEVKVHDSNEKCKYDHDYDLEW